MAKVEEEATVGMLSVKLPTFWPDMPEVWFAQAEANFRARRITSQKSKFNLVVVALDADTLKGVLDLIEREPDEELSSRQTCGKLSQNRWDPKSTIPRPTIHSRTAWSKDSTGR